VRTVTIGEDVKYSYELCGGTHVDQTGDIGLFLIKSESSAAAGVRRIEAVTGRGAYELIARRFRALKQAAATLKSAVDEVPQKVENLVDEVADLKKELGTLRAERALATFSNQLSAVKTVMGVSVLVADVPNSNPDTLRILADKFREKYPMRGAAVLVTGTTVISVLTDDLVKGGLKAADLIASIGGRGGGRPNLAQGSLRDHTEIDDALSKAIKMMEEKLK
jgi:alanyl-tRNA synthetase